MNDGDDDDDDGDDDDEEDDAFDDGDAKDGLCFWRWYTQLWWWYTQLVEKLWESCPPLPTDSCIKSGEEGGDDELVLATGDGFYVVKMNTVCE